MNPEGSSLSLSLCWQPGRFSCILYLCTYGVVHKFFSICYLALMFLLLSQRPEALGYLEAGLCLSQPCSWPIKKHHPREFAPLSFLF